MRVGGLIYFHLSPGQGLFKVLVLQGDLSPYLRYTIVIKYS